MKFIKTFIFLIFIISLNSKFIEAQNLDKAFFLIQQHQYNKAVKILDKAINKKKDYLYALYGKIIIWTKNDYPKQNIHLAFYQAGREKKLYKKLPEEKKNYYKKKYKFSYKNIDSIIAYIYKSEYYKAKNSQSISALKHYIRYYPNSPYSKKAKFTVDSLIFKKMVPNNSAIEYKNFLNTYPNSTYYTLAKKKYYKILDSLYSESYRKLDYSKIQDFDATFPNYCDTIDSAKIYKRIAKIYTKLRIQEGYFASLNGKYQKFINNYPNYPQTIQVLILLAKNNKNIYKKQAIIDTLNKYKLLFNNKYKNIIDKKIQKILNRKKYSISSNINTKYNEYYPVLSTDGKTLYFCSDNNPKGIGGEDVFVSHLKNGIWTKPKLVKDFSSAYTNDAVMSISADENKVLLFINGKIFKTHKTTNGWSKKTEFKELNSGNWNGDACYTADGKALLFASQRKENINAKNTLSRNIDIYVVVKQKNGSWSKPINLGKTINSSGIERSPFLHPDMKTLYFSADRADSYGGLDIYKSTRLNDTSWTQWSKPINLGKNINTANDEYGFKISTDGNFGIYGGVSADSSNQDIFIVPISQKNKPNKVVIVTGIVSDNKNNPLDANVFWEDLETGKQLGHLTSDPQTGKFIIPLPIGKNYGFFVSKKGYYPVSDNINLNNKNTPSSITKNFVMNSINNIINGDISIELKNVFFDFNKYTLKKESYPELHRLADFIKSNPKIKIEISGHTDNIGNKTYNQKLSQLRADAVKKYLIYLGCPADNLIAKGYGEAKPIAPNNTEKGKAKNRRVEFRVLKK